MKMSHALLLLLLLVIGEIFVSALVRRVRRAARERSEGPDKPIARLFSEAAVHSPAVPKRGSLPEAPD